MKSEKDRDVSAGVPRRPWLSPRTAAIAVLIMVFIGVGLWVAFDGNFQNTAENVNNQVNCIGQFTGNC